MTQRNFLIKWERTGERIRLEFLDGSIMYVKKQDFDRAFGCIINLTKEQVQADFAIEAEERVITAQILNEYMTYQATTNTARQKKRWRTVSSSPLPKSVSTL